jgi:hypothetical protein
MKTPDLSDEAHKGSFSMDEKCNSREREATIEEFWPAKCLPLITDQDPLQPRTSGATRAFYINEKAMRKLDALTVAIPAILVAASIANAVFLPVPQGPIRACPFGAIWAAIWNVASGR